MVRLQINVGKSLIQNLLNINLVLKGFISLLPPFSKGCCPTRCFVFPSLHCKNDVEEEKHDKHGELNMFIMRSLPEHNLLKRVYI